MSVHLPSVGELFRERYELRDVLGRGGSAVVFLAFDHQVRRQVALKVLAPTDDDGYTAVVVGRFNREAKLLAGLRDPHTITMFDFGSTDDGLLFMVTEYVDGRALSSMLAQEGALDQDVAVHIVRQLCSALREAHAAGVLHRDIKPGNILVYSYAGDPHRVKLIDFGIAKPTGDGAAIDLTQTGALVGTPRYMSPEALSGQRATPATDVYSLGLVLFEMLVGRPAVAEEDTRRTILAQLSSDPIYVPSEVVVDSWLRRLVHRMTDRDPQRRIATVDEVLEIVEENLAARRKRTRSQADAADAAAMPVPTETTDDEAVGVDRTFVAIAGLGVGALLAFLIVMLTSDDEPPPPPPVTAAPAVVSTPSPPRESPVPLDRDDDAAGDASGFHRDAGLGRDDDAETSRDEPPRRSGPSVGCGKPAPFAATKLLATRVEGELRNWHVYIPPDYDPERPHPVVMLFHNSPYDGAYALENYGFLKIADEHDLVLVSPSSSMLFQAWMPDVDMKIAARALEETAKLVCIDWGRVFATGPGSGERAVERLPCFVSVAALAGSGFRESGSETMCDVSRPVPYMHLLGRTDPHMPREGGQSCAGFPLISHDMKVAKWKRINGCEGPPRLYSDHRAGVCQTWTCEEPLVICEVDGGNNWPGVRPSIVFPGCTSPASSYPYQREIWKFFSQF